MVILYMSQQFVSLIGVEEWSMTVNFFRITEWFFGSLLTPQSTSSVPLSRLFLPLLNLSLPGKTKSLGKGLGER